MLKFFSGSGLRWLWLTVVMFAVDQISKHWVVGSMKLYDSIPVIPMFSITYVQNHGAAFSFLSTEGGWQRWFFTVIAVVVSVLILYWLKKTEAKQKLVPSAFALILSGALGNVYDRLHYGYVIDFLDVYYQQWHWPTFNIADSAIFVGAVFLIYDAMRSGNKKDEQATNH
ncbi:signal peptidase II [Neptunicella marina]|uniref:Lipoprotein signal peptidase n=1 Tax=Neptunicella marina TaxID=2125989 RepID=A0A8J6ITQ2_9ALTE|nr:signal peptidase II [Neptunicella marina]MBC3765438.1 signal peptidase II [Neptunicella marina]